MKLKHVLNEGPISYRGAGGERYAAWEEPDDEGPEYEAPSVEGETVMPYCTADGTEIKAKVKYSGSRDERDDQVHIDEIDIVAIVLPSGKEVDPDTAMNILGQDQFDPNDQGSKEALIDWLSDHLEGEMGGAKVWKSDKYDQRFKTPAAPAQASAPAAAPTKGPTVA